MAAPATPTTFRIDSFGCKVNQAEAAALAADLRALGLGDAGAGADLVIVNTCAVTGEAARQGRQRIRRARRRGAAVVVTGCGAHPAARDAWLAAAADLLLVEPDKGRVAREVARLLALGLPGAGAAPGADDDGGDVGAATYHAAPVASPADPRGRANLKVQDGCPGGCAYCIVPHVRPAVWSLPPEEAARQARDLVAAGFREVVLCGIHLGLYGVDLRPQVHLADLAARLLAVEGLGRLRLSSIEPMEVDARLLGLMASEPERLCPHLHVPLQSGDDGVLAAMGRPYTAAEFLAKVAEIRAALPLPAVTTDVLVGLPGESDAAFAGTLRVAREAHLARMHVFPFSRRAGTPAADMPGQVPRDVVRARRAAASALGDELAAAYRAGFIGRTVRVAVERLLPGGDAEGVSERYLRVRLRGPLPPGAGHREIVTARALGLEADGLVAAPVGPRSGAAG